ncbi:MAG TPA: RluA family pseudouridine synthase [Verrucomicrobiales bacterium]|nr:RluA family pseudouridine synthase [Verrucomicrobiales bacterium]
MPVFTQTLTIGRSDPGERMDSYLRQFFPGVSRKALVRLIREGHILVNGEQVKPRHFPKAGEVIEITWPEAREPVADPEDIPLNVLHEDSDLIVLNKEPGIVVHPGNGHEEHTLVNALLHHCEGELSGVGGVARPGIVHRLDKDTSGCMVVAKNDFTHLGLAKQFADRSMEKIYLALLCGDSVPPSGNIRAAIARHPSHRKRMAVREGEHGRAAHTSYRVLQRYQGATLVEAHLHTGRTHQIRVHFQYIGFPLVGDATYGKRQNNRLKDLTGYVAPRQMLHAHSIAFNHPRSGIELTFRAELPKDFEEALEALKPPPSETRQE